MKAIKVTYDNAVAIESALTAVNGKATAHTYSRATEVISLATAEENKLTRLLGAKKHFRGAVLISTSGAAVSNSYCKKAFRPRVATRIELERRATDWYLIAVSAASVWKSGGGSFLTLTHEQDATAVARLRAQYSLSVYYSTESVPL